MSSELIVVGLLAILVGVALGIVLARRPAAPPSPLPPELVASLKDVGALRSQVETLAQTQNATQKALGDLQGKLSESAGSVKTDVLAALHTTQRSLEAFKADYAARKSQEETLQEAVRGIEAVLVGSSSRGGAGENVLAEAFQKFPAEMLETNFRVAGKTVEYALVLPSNRRLPIDSKWPAMDLLDELARTTDAGERLKLTDQVEQAALRKAAEVEKYVDPRLTVNLAVAAVPDAVFFCCRQAHIEAFRKHRVLLMPYSLTLPYLLAVYNLYLQHGRSVEFENLNNFLSQVEAQMALLEDIVQNRIARIHAMSLSSRDDLMSVLASVRVSLQQLRVLPEPVGKALGENEPT